MNSSAILDKVSKVVNFQKISAKYGLLLRNNKKRIQENPESVIKRLSKSAELFMNF